MRLLAGEKLADHFVHDVLRWEEVGEEGGEDAGDDAGLVGEPLPDPVPTHARDSSS